MGWKTEKTRMNRLVSLKIATETIQNETGREKKLKQIMNTASVSCGATSNGLTYM